jgi:ubiquinone/menaquinone biosynthesis C-methylase UbiE
VCYREGLAENIPLQASGCDVVVMRNLVWHITEALPQVVAEIARVLGLGGHVMVHSCFSDRPFTPTMLWHSPRRTEVHMFPSVEQILATFHGVGLNVSAEMVIDTGYLLVLASVDEESRGPTTPAGS